MKVLAVVLNVQAQEVNVFSMSIYPGEEFHHPVPKKQVKKLTRLVKEELTIENKIDWNDNGHDDPPQLTHLILATNWVLECPRS
jgi:hypothetical protein